MLAKVSFIFVVLFLLISPPLMSETKLNSPINPLIDSPGNTFGSDFNGDGINDILIGAPLNNDGGSNSEGAAYIFFGASNLSGTKDTANTDEDVRLLGKGVEDRLGRFSNAGDFNGDGLDDIIVGAYRNNDGGSDNEGAAYIFFGATNLTGTKDTGTADEDVRILGKAAQDGLGLSVSNAGDVNGDGFDDFIIGAYRNDEGGTDSEGAAYIFFGSATLSGDIDVGGAQSANFTILGKAANDNLGVSVSGVGDVNGDGFDDVIVGAYFNNDGGSNNEGAAYIFFGASDLSGTKALGLGQSADVTVLGKGTTDLLGNIVSGAGDVNGDGFDDFIVGARQNNDGGSDNEGAAYVFFGASNLSGTFDMGGGVQSPNVTIFGKATTDLLGNGIAGAGDVNGDGIDDIIVGAPNNNDGGTNNEGAAYIFFGASDLSGTKALGLGQSADFTVLGEAVTDRLGVSVAGVGDVNADGIADILIGAQYGGPSNEGTA